MAYIKMALSGSGEGTRRRHSSASGAPAVGTARRAKGRVGEQLALAFPATWGGARAGAGRKRAERGNVPHRARPRHRWAEPVHVTLRARIAPLRSQHVFPTVRLALLRAARRDPDAFRLLHYSVQRDHVHLLVEARDERALSSGMRSIAIRVARYVNDLLRRRGALWADRWHGRALKTPREVRAVLVYVLANFRKHSRVRCRTGIDPYSSGEWFDGWRHWAPGEGRAPPWAELARWADWDRGAAGNGAGEASARVVATPRTWLARVGWRRRGPIALDEAPAA
jgi:REP element-mobilizing transposase RayT